MVAVANSSDITESAEVHIPEPRLVVLPIFAHTFLSKHENSDLNYLLHSQSKLAMPVK